MFEAIDVSGTGMHVHQTWLNAISDNVANINTVNPYSQSAFQARYVVAQALEDGGTGAGVAVAGIKLSSAQGRITYDPSNPNANAQGYVRLPDIDLGEQMSDMIMAQRGFQANSSNIDRIKESYQSAIQMGKS